MRLSEAQIAPLPLDQDQDARLRAALTDLTPEQLHWVSGYAAGMAAANGQVAVAPAPAAEPGNTLTILYGSQTGNGEAIARQLEARAADAGFAVKLTSLAEFKPSSLKRETLVTFVVSTHGEGDPPDDAELFREFLLSKKAPKLPNLRYSVLALGDSSYVNFCQTGREFDERLAELGATRFADPVECDVDYEDAATAWSDAVLAAVPNFLSADTAVPRLRAVETVSPYDRSNPFEAEVLVNQKITAHDSTKDVRHIELSLEDSGIRYEPGDALAVIASNPPALVERVIDLLALDAKETVSVADETVELAAALTDRLEITATSLTFLRAWAEYSASDELNTLLDDEHRQQLAEFIDSHQIVDVIRDYPAGIDAQSFVSMLRKLSPRSYSIASSLEANPDEVHLTVAAVRYDAFGERHWGAASTHLADRLDEGDTVKVFVEPNSRFSLPANDAADVIMIGPGTGVAPFRAFVEERAERDAGGRNWLFFGDRNFSSDFLYQLEWQRHLKQGNLDRLDVAFSRDQAEKDYVQDRIRDNAAELYQWLSSGAHIYVCGDAKHMAGDVEDALVDVIASQGGVTADDALQQLKELRRAGRYQRDVY